MLKDYDVGHGLTFPVCYCKGAVRFSQTLIVCIELGILVHAAQLHIRLDLVFFCCLEVYVTRFHLGMASSQNW